MCYILITTKKYTRQNVIPAIRITYFMADWKYLCLNLSMKFCYPFPPVFPETLLFAGSVLLFLDL